jgi:hypothetical protein
LRPTPDVKTIRSQEICSLMVLPLLDREEPSSSPGFNLVRGNLHGSLYDEGFDGRSSE